VLAKLAEMGQALNPLNLIQIMLAKGRKSGKGGVQLHSSCKVYAQVFASPGVKYTFYFWLFSQEL
jgi:hypothetical protein